MSSEKLRTQDEEEGSEETIMEAHTGLDLILDNAVTEVVKKLKEFLEKHAAQWRER